MTLAAGGKVDVADITNIGLTKIQFGSAAASITATTSTIVTVTFPVAFATTPQVAVSIRTAAGAAIGSFIQITAISTTSVNIRWGLPASGTASCNLDWIAVA